MHGDGSAFGLPLPGYALAMLAYAAFGLRVWLRMRREPKTEAAPRMLYAAALTSAAWAACGLVVGHWDVPGGHVVLGLLDVLRYGCWFGFLLILLNSGAVRGVRKRGLGRLTAAGVFVLAGGALGSFADPEAVRPDTLYRIALFLSMMLPVFGLVLVEQLFRGVADDLQWGVKPICLGLCCIFGFDFYVYSEAALFARFDGDALSIRAFVHAFAVPFLIVASRRNSDWVQRLRVSRSAAFHSVALLLAGLYLLFIAAIGYYVRYFGGSWGRALQLGTLAIALTALAAVALSGSMRAKLRVVLGKHFFSYRYDYRREWLRFTATLSSSNAPQETGMLVIRGLADMLESPAGGLWSKATNECEYVQTARWNLAHQPVREPGRSAFSAFMLQTGWVVDLEQCRAGAPAYEGLEVPDWLLSNPEFWLVTPLIVAEELIGFVVLTRARTTVELNWEVTDLLKTASRQAASILAQMRATEALLEARKFDSFNRMSAFVVHDLKNIVTQLSLMLRNAQRLRDNQEFYDDMLMTIESSLEKMRQLMLQLREGETPPGGVSGVALLPILLRIEAVARSRDRSLELRVVDRAVTRGHEERVERVLGHIVQNALDATEASGTVTVTLARAGGRAKVVVRDAGDGMSPEFVQTRLFKPFQTTKVNGMGIGAYESFQYIQELGGSITVDSQLGSGTVVTILMPLFDSRQTSDLQMLGEP